MSDMNKKNIYIYNNKLKLIVSLSYGNWKIIRSRGEWGYIGHCFR